MRLTYKGWIMITWLDGIKGQAGDRGQTGLRPSPGVIIGEWLIMVHAAGDVPAWKTKQLQSRFTFISPRTSVPLL